MADRETLTAFWQGYSDAPSVQTMMLYRNAEEIEELDRRDILNALPDLTGLRVVEIGGGIGRYTSSLAAQAKHVLSTDFVQSFVDKNKEINSHFGNVTFQCVDAARLALEPESCDFVFTNWLLMYLTDVEVVRFLQSVLRWLSPNGYIHIRESCSQSSKRTNGKSADPSFNPTYYRHIYQYLSLIDKLRFHDQTSGKMARFEFLWAKSVETYVKGFRNWRQVHMLVRKVWTEDIQIIPDEPRLICELSSISLQNREKFHERMAARVKKWSAWSPLEGFLLKCLKERLALNSSSTILCLFSDMEIALSPFAVAETLGCKAHNVYKNFSVYDYNLAEANDRNDERLRFYLLGQPVTDIGQWFPRQYYDAVVGSQLLRDGKLDALRSLIKPGGKIVLLEELDEAVTVWQSGRKHHQNGYAELVNVQEVTKEVKESLLAADPHADQTPETTELIGHETWLTAEETKWCIVTVAAK